MNILHNPMRLKAATTYNAAADHYDDPKLAFWDRHGRRTVRLLQLTPGARILDVGCGTGAATLPAAVGVGPDGHVTGIDIAENMLNRAAAKAQARGLANVTFELADMSASGQPDARFDAVISVFSIFFVRDISGQVAELWRLVRPGGQLAITVWGRGAFEPASSIFAEELRRVRPDIPVSGRPWERLTDPADLRRLLLEAGTTEPTIQAMEDIQPLWQPADWWTIALGTGFRWEIDQLTAEQQETVRARTTRRLAKMAVTAIETSALCAIARKPR